MVWFYIATLTPAGLLAAACLLGGPFSLMVVVSITVLVFVMDRLVSTLMPDTLGRNGLVLSVTLACVHFGLWGLGVFALGGDHLAIIDKVLIFIGLGLFFGQISNSNAHELIHNAARGPRRLGIAVYCSVLFGHHASAHTKVHHVHAATWKDPNTARLGEGFWRYLLRAWHSGFYAGKEAEDLLRARSQSMPNALSHPYLGYVAGALIALFIAFSLSGLSGVLALLGLAIYAQVQLYLSDYVQHYGLMRAIDEDGRVAPMGPHHSWNAPHWYSNAMMLNAPRHSDHHTHPSRPFPDLRLDSETMPTLPQSLPVMAVLALIPPVWRKVMDRRAKSWVQRNRQISGT